MNQLNRRQARFGTWHSCQENDKMLVGRYGSATPLMGGNANKGIGDEGSAPVAARDSVRAGAPAAPDWLSSNKVIVPDRVSGYVHRPGLLERLDPTRRRVTVLKAPSGFGKTVLLAESCRDLRSAGTIAAWLTVGANDVPQALDAYLAFAFEHAGLNILETLGAHDARRGRPVVLGHGTALLGMAVERHGAACVLVLDELEQLKDGGSLSLLTLLLAEGPPNLHIAFACREIPASVDVASLVLAGRGQVISAEELRFSRSDVARFLGPDVPRRRADALARESRGWPIALRVLGNKGLDAKPEGADVGIDIADNWMESRLLRGLSETDRDLLLDAGLFDWLDAGLLDEVLGTSGAKRRVEAIPALAGLLESVGEGRSGSLRLHALIREHCGRWRLRRTPDRFRRIHRRIAKALAQRGEAVVAMRHAVEAADMALAGDILEHAGGVWLWVRGGLAPLHAADRLLTAELVAERPRLALARCLVALLTGRLGEARNMYRAAAARRPGVVRDPSAEDLAYQHDDTMVRGMLVLYGCENYASNEARTLVSEKERFTADDRVDPLIRGCFEYGLCIAHNVMAKFDLALDRAERARRGVPAGKFLEVYIELSRGQIAMARGEVAQAARRYGRALRRVRESYLRDPGPTVLGEALVAELNLERNRLAGIRFGSEGPDLYFEGPVSFVACAARAGVALDVRREREGIDAALSAVEEMLDGARAAALPVLVRYLAAERVSLLVAGGRVDEADRAWRFDGLPRKAAECLDLAVQSWREMEALACAKLRLLTALGEFEAGRRFADELIAVASVRDLWRTRMRALALAVALERTANRPSEAERRLREFLGLFAQADYSRPLVRERSACLPALESFIANSADSRKAGDARRLLAMLTESERSEGGGPTFGSRELEVMQRLESCSDRQIGQALSLTPGGVRYHVANIFRKLDVRDRRTAARRAREMGLLP